MILENLTKEKLDEVLTKGKKIADSEMGMKGFKTYMRHYYLDKEVFELIKSDKNSTEYEEASKLHLIDIPNKILIKLIHEGLLVCNKEEKIRIINELNDFISYEDNKKENIKIESKYDINLNGFSLHGMLEVDSMFKLADTVEHVGFNCGLLLMGVDPSKDNAIIINEKIEDSAEIYKIASCKDEENYAIITIIVEDEEKISKNKL